MILFSREKLGKYAHHWRITDVFCEGVVKEMLFGTGFSHWIAVNLGTVSMLNIIHEVQTSKPNQMCCNT